MTMDIEASNFVAEFIRRIAAALEKSGWQPGIDPIPIFPQEEYQYLRNLISRRDMIFYESAMERVDVWAKEPEGYD